MQIEIVPTEYEHFEPLWKIMSSLPEYWAESGAIETYGEFEMWFRSRTISPLTGLDNGEVIGCGYLDTVYPGHYASVNIFKEPRRNKMKEVVMAYQGALKYWVEKYDLEKLIGIIRSDNRASRLLAKMMGFRTDGVLRHHKQVNGVWTNYLLTSVLRSEL